MSTSLQAPRGTVPARGDDHGHGASAVTSAVGAFTPRARRLGVAYVAATLPLVALGSTLLPAGHVPYIRGYVYLASGIYTTPALVITWKALPRVAAHQRWRWKLWLVGLVLTYTTGLGMLAGIATGSGALDPVAAPIVALIALLFIVVLVSLVRSRSGRRALTVDVTEWAMWVLVVVAPSVLLWADDVVTSSHSWFTVPAALGTVGALSGVYWTVVLFMRLRPARWPLEMTVVKIGVALVLVGVANGVAQMAQGLSGFTQPAMPALTLQAACMSMLLLIPLFLPSDMSPGFERLPPQAQVRGAGLAPVVTLLGLPVLLAVTLFERREHSWAPLFSLVVVALLLVLTVLRHLAAVTETRRLYALVEKASDERRQLLARVIQRMNDDRHAVAAQLHEQAMSAYATFVSFMTSRSPVGNGTQSQAALSSASNLLRDDLAQQAESLRQLMLAIRPMAMERSRSASLSTPIQAYVDSLYGDGPAPRLEVAVDDEVMLDWITETIVSRIVQEAIRNVWRHSSASHVWVSIRADGERLDVRVRDDGIGFDPTASLFESGIAAMRSFAAFGNGSLRIESSPGEGTTVIARLGEEPPAAAPPEEEPRVPHLRLVRPDERASDHERAST